MLLPSEHRQALGGWASPHKKLTAYRRRWIPGQPTLLNTWPFLVARVPTFAVAPADQGFTTLKMTTRLNDIPSIWYP